jgi:hypothetical protein
MWEKPQLSYKAKKKEREKRIMASKSNSPAKWKKANAHLRLNKHLAER